MISRIYHKFNVKVNHNNEIPGIQSIAEDIDTKEEVLLNKILDENYELLLRLQKFSGKLFERSKYISEVSYQAALKINANGKVTKAGGMYSKIGRTISKDYIIDGIRLLEEYEFPQNVIDIVKQHSLKFGNPRSKEAAIVMISDNIIASLDAMKNMKDSKPIPTNKLIDGIFTLRLSKSNLDESGLSITDLKYLKEFYINEFNKTNDE